MQKFTSWETAYNTGNLVIDYQNRRLLQLINELEEVSLNVELNPALLDIVFDELAEYTNYHFKTEENIMEQVNYSQKEDHKILHKEFINQINIFKLKIQQGPLYIDHVFCDFLKTWLVGHISNEDHKIISEMSTGQGIA